MKNDLRYQALKRGLSQLTIEQLERILHYKDEMVYDEYNFNPETKRF